MQSNATQSGCCGPTPVTMDPINPTINPQLDPNNIPEVSTELSLDDRLGSFKARWGIMRMKYTITPGLYKVNNATKDSPVFVSCNYKMSFDILRKNLTGIDGWILVLDTKGINVWCAAGKGTFGTKELINRGLQVQLQNVVSHRKIIVPQLGAPGISAHEVLKQTGFKVIYGPVRAKDIKEFLDNNLRTTPEMRKVNFSFIDRIVLTPMEIVPSLKLLPIMFLILLFVQLIKFGNVNTHIFIDLLPYAGSIFIGAFLTQALLPFIPFRSFALKGAALGIIFSILISAFFNISIYEKISYFLILPSVAAYLSLNFTGSSTFTSLSGVEKEIKYSIPMVISSIAVGIILKLF